MITKEGEREREREGVDRLLTDCLSIMEEDEVLPVRGGDEAQIWKARIIHSKRCRETLSPLL